MELFYAIPKLNLTKTSSSSNHYRMNMISMDKEYTLFIPKEKINIEKETNQMVIGGSTPVVTNEVITLHVSFDNFDLKHQSRDLLKFINEPTTRTPTYFDIIITKIQKKQLKELSVIFINVGYMI